MSRSERTRTTLLAALGLVLGAIALWQPVGPITDSPGQRLVLDVPTWVQFVLLVATLFRLSLNIATTRQIHARMSATPGPSA